MCTAVWCQRYPCLHKMAYDLSQLSIEVLEHFLDEAKLSLREHKSGKQNNLTSTEALWTGLTHLSAILKVRETYLSKASNRFPSPRWALKLAWTWSWGKRLRLGSEECVEACRISPANGRLCKIQDRFLRKVGEAHLHAKSGLCIRLLNCSEIFLKFYIFRDHFPQFWALLGSSLAETLSTTCPLHYLKETSGSLAKTTRNSGFLGWGSFKWALPQLMYRYLSTNLKFRDVFYELSDGVAMGISRKRASEHRAGVYWPWSFGGLCYRREHAFFDHHLDWENARITENDVQHVDEARKP